MRLFSSRMKGSLRLTKSKVSLRKLEFASHGFTFLLRLSLAKSPSVLPERAHPPCLLPSTPPRPVSPRGLKPAFLTLCLWHQLPGLEMSQGADPSDGKPGAGGPFLYPVPPPRLPALEGWKCSRCCMLCARGPSAVCSEISPETSVSLGTMWACTQRPGWQMLGAAGSPSPGPGPRGVGLAACVPASGHDAYCPRWLTGGGGVLFAFLLHLALL